MKFLTIVRIFSDIKVDVIRVISVKISYMGFTGVFTPPPIYVPCVCSFAMGEGGKGGEGREGKAQNIELDTSLY